MPEKKGFVKGRKPPPGYYGGQVGLLQWVSEKFPAAYDRLRRSRPDLVVESLQLAGLQDGPQTAADKINQIANALMPLLQLDAQRKLLNAQVKRAKAGLPPLQVENLQLPAARVQVDAGANVRTLGKYVGAAALALGGLWVLSRGLRAQR